MRRSKGDATFVDPAWGVTLFAVNGAVGDLEATAAPELAQLPAARSGLSRGAASAEFLLTGGGTLVLLPLAWALRHALGLDAAEYAAGFLTFYGAYVINDPHFSVTYFLFYRGARTKAFGAHYSVAQRARYWFAGALVPLALVGWAAAALATRSAPALGWMIQLMFLLVGWHYVKQGFGVLTVLSARRGVRLSPSERRAFLVHAFAAWGFAWANPATKAGEFEEKGVVFWGIAHPRSLEIATGTVLAGSVVALLWVLVSKWRRERKTVPLAPLTGFLVTLWFWTIGSSVDPVMRYLIPALHSVQYLYFVWLMTRNEARAHEGPPSFGRPPAVRVGLLALSALGLGWFLFRGAPTFLDTVTAPSPRHHSVGDALGDTPFFAAFFVAVNLHHYFMDFVVWRRENPDAAYLQEPLAEEG